MAEGSRPVVAVMMMSARPLSDGTFIFLKGKKVPEIKLPFPRTIENGARHGCICL